MNAPQPTQIPHAQTSYTQIPAQEISHAQPPEQKTAVILLNMGGPTDISGVEGFLRNIFSDPLILRIKSSFVRKMVGSLIINKRLESVKQNYQKIGGFSPLPMHTFALCERLNALARDDRQKHALDSSQTASHRVESSTSTTTPAIALDSSTAQESAQEPIFFTYAMRYTPPFARDVLRDLQEKGVNDIVLVSMYPQFSTTTTQSSLQDIYDNLKALSYKPRVSVIKEYHAYEPFYELIAESIERTLYAPATNAPATNSTAQTSRDASDFTLILSAHSLPQKIVKGGDPYVSQCEKGVEILTNVLHKRGLHFASIKLSYQSKVGPMKWLSPFTSDVIAESKGQNLIIYPLAFTIDNSETDYELNIEYRELAREVGVLEYLVCPCFNDSLPFATMLYQLVCDKLIAADTPVK